jgi:DNA-binding response OmpR family regulator
VDCLLLDVMMPGLSGFELARRIRETSDVPILFLSARDTPTDKIRGLIGGGDDYIVKSATAAEVVARVKAVLHRTRRGTPPVDAGVPLIVTSIASQSFVGANGRLHPLDA